MTSAILLQAFFIGRDVGFIFLLGMCFTLFTNLVLGTTGKNPLS